MCMSSCDLMSVFVNGFTEIAGDNMHGIELLHNWLSNACSFDVLAL